MRGSHNESPWTRKISDQLRGCAALVFAVVGGQRQESGWPDRHVLHPRWWGWLEFKADHTRVSTLQSIVIKRINDRCPGHAFVVRRQGSGPHNVEDAEGNCLAKWSTAKELIDRLEELSRE